MDTDLETEHKPGPAQEQEEPLSGVLHLPAITATGAQRMSPAAPSTSSVSGSVPLDQALEDHEQNVFYFRDDREEDEDFSASLARPFQLSEALPPVSGSAVNREASPLTKPALPVSPPGNPSRGRWSLVRILIGCAVIVILILTGTMVFAQSPTAMSLPSLAAATTGAPPQHNTAPMPPVPPQLTPPGQQGNTGPVNIWLPQHLPGGWTNAGLTLGDALESERTAVVFTDREMSLDYRSAGTRAQHGGTFTASTFILTDHARIRFAQQDVRAFNNVLFDAVQQEKRIQAVVNTQPSLLTFAVMGQEQLAGVDVSFQLWESKIDATGMRTEGFDLDPTNGQPRTHHMMVLLLRVPQATQGNSPAMGGTGWLVSTYAFDLPAGTTLEPVQPA